MEAHWLLRLSSLPPLIYTRVVDRMLNGESVHSIARWLVGQSLGGLKGAGEETLRKYLYSLVAKVAEQKRRNPPPTTAQM